MKNKEQFTKFQELVYELKVGDAMITDVITVKPTRKMSELRKILKDHRISGVPVTGKKSSLIGMISIEDFIKWLLEGATDCTIQERMTEDVKRFYADEPLVHAVGKFEKSGYGRFPVVERKTGKLIGIITKGVIIEKVLRKLEIDYQEEEIHRYRASHLFEDIIADNISLVLKFHIEGKNFDKAGEVSSKLKRTLSRLNIHPQIVRRISIASYEAELNIVIYTDGGDVTARIQPDLFRIDMYDFGPGIPDVKKVLKPGYSTAPDWVRELGFGAGMGLTNIQKCADNFHLVSKMGVGTHLRFDVNLN